MTPAKKIKVTVLGATGSVGRTFVKLLAKHPWFTISALAASQRSAGKTYGDVVQGQNGLPASLTGMKLQQCVPGMDAKIAFSGLDASVAGEIEEQFAQAGYIVVSNARNHRMRADVPLLIPEVNAGHLALIERQKYGKGGAIVTNPNCSTVGLAMALKPLHDFFGVSQVHVVTLQALSGAGYPGVPALDISDNVLPHIEGEEEKLQNEPLKLFGTLEKEQVKPAKMKISASCNRVAVSDGHLECVSLKLAKQAKPGQLIEAWQNFTSPIDGMDLPSAPRKTIYYFDDARFPQPRLHRDLEGGMAVSIGGLKKCPIMDYKFKLLVHNTIRGAAGGALLNAELLLKKGYIT